MQNLLNELVEVLQQDQSLLSDGKLLKAAVIERSDKLDSALLKLLLGSEPLRRALFADVDGVLVFDKVRFADFVSNKAFLPDSYTAFRNHIGLTDGRGRFVSRTNDVVLAWPYKDCVLEGGMTKEDAGRDELFWNTTLAPDDVTRLFEPKALHHFERWDREAVAAGKPKPVGAIGEDDNLLIKGNNLLALHSLKQCYAGQVKLIYIDPPYNTGDDGFSYNDRFFHSTWLTFITNRLQAARGLLHREGVIAINIDDRELGYLLTCVQEVFSTNKIKTISVKMSEASGVKMASVKKQGSIPKIKETVVVCKPSGLTGFKLPFIRKGAWDSEYNLGVRGLTRELRDRLDSLMLEEDVQKASEQIDAILSSCKLVPLSELAAPARVDDEWRFDNAFRIVRTAASSSAHRLALDKRDATEQQLFTVVTTQKLIYLVRGDFSDAKAPRVQLLFADDNLSVHPGDFWSDIVTTGLEAEGGVEFKNGKKPEALLARIIAMATKKGDLVLDFFAGSGTTAAVALKLDRRWIAVEQLGYAKTKTASRLRNVVGGEQGGVFKAQNWTGGGSFVYAELTEANEAFGHRIRTATDSDALDAVIADVKATGYWHYKVDQSRFDWGALTALPFDERRQVLLDSLDANHLYVNYGDIADEAYGMSDEDIAVNRAFYGDRA